MTLSCSVMFDHSTLVLAAEPSPEWTSLLPAIVAITLAILIRSVLPALFLAICCGVMLLQPDDDSWIERAGESVLITITETLPQEISPLDGGQSHVQILLFTLCLGSLIGVMSASGGTAAIVDVLTPLTGSRRGGMIATWLLGLVIFFDDYANSLLVGSTMRPITDRLRISREKLAFLVDATAAPVSGLAIVSTWVGFEVGLIDDAFARLATAHADMGISVDGYGTFLATLPYRFYPLLILVFVALIAWSGRDFGAMVGAERRALRTEEPPSTSADIPSPQGNARGTVWNAVLPLAVLFAALLLGLYWTGTQAVGPDERSLRAIISNAESNVVLLASSFLASVAGVLLAVANRSLSFIAAVEAWVAGAKGMFLGCCVLVLAWAIATVCDGDHLNTAGYLVESTRGWLQPTWLPAMTFVLSGAIAFATGSSWATMGLVIPLVIEVTFSVLTGAESGVSAAAVHRDPLMLASIGGVLAGAIFGDHCSPISDTTVLSSIAADCDHIAHVTTQFPYALTVGMISLVCCCLPSGFGVPWWLTLPLGLIACGIAVRAFGRPLEGDDSAG